VNTQTATIGRKRNGFFSALSIIAGTGVLFIALAASPSARAAETTNLNATAHGVVGDGVTLNTDAIQKAIDDCGAGGGGTIQFPAGRYLTGTIQLKDNVTLHLDENAVLLGSTKAADYRNVDPFIDGVGQKMGYALIVGVGASHVGIEGAGTIDGQGKKLKAAQSPYTVRPFLMRWLHCTNVAIRDVHLANPGAWTLNFFQTRNATVERVTIRTRDTGLSNNDGIDLDSCEGARIRDCDIDSGDDALCFKATSPLPCRDIIATGCKLSTKCNAIKFGTESLGDFEDIHISDCQIRNTRISGIALNSVDGAHLQNVTIDGITMNGVAAPISMRLGARLKTFRAGDQPKPPGILRDVTIKNLRVTGARQIGILINGIPGHPVENVSLENIQIELPGGGSAASARVKLAEKEAAYPEYDMFGKVIPAYGIYARHVRGISFSNVQTTVIARDARPEKVLIDVEGVTPADFAGVTNSAAKSSTH
jgi:polygalacturonase